MTGNVATKSKRKKFTSRAALRLIEPGSSVDCAHCDQRVKFQARVRLQQVICNVYIDGAWDRVEHFHAECYSAAGDPHGAPEVSAATNPRRAAANAPDAPPAPTPAA